MNQLILVKYASEIFLKGLNRGKFERKLLNNIIFDHRYHSSICRKSKRIRKNFSS